MRTRVARGLQLTGGSFVLFKDRGYDTEPLTLNASTTLAELGAGGGR